jgi:O-antigen/teichoic acid export membrane protein
MDRGNSFMFKSLSKLSLVNLRTRFQEQSVLKRQAILGVFWSVVTYGLGTGLRVGSSLIMTRLLFPEIFGLMSLVNIIIMGLHLFSDVGSAPTVIRSDRGDDPELLNNVWTIQVIRGVVLWIGCLILAVPAAHLYAEPQLYWLLPIVGLICISGSFSSTAVFTLVRHMEQGKRSVFDLQNQIISTVLLVTIVWFNRSIWGLVIGYLLGDLIQTIRSHFLIPNYRNRFALNWQIVKEMSTFGRWILLSTMLTFLAGQVDRLLVGKMLSWHFLGIYAVVMTISEMPRSIIERVAEQVIFPAASQFIESPRAELRQKLLHNRRPVLMAMALGLALLVGVGDILVTVMYDSRYAPGAWMLPIVLLGIWPNVLFQTLYPVLLALSKPQYQTWGNAGKFLFTGLGLPLAYAQFGAVGVILVVAFNDLPLYGAIIYGLWREKLTSLRQDFTMTAFLVMVLAGILSLRYALGFGFPIDRLWAT